MLRVGRGENSKYLIQILHLPSFSLILKARHDDVLTKGYVCNKFKSATSF